MKRAVVAFALCAAAFAATPASACFFATPCGAEVYVPAYDADLPPPQILAVVKQRGDGGLSLAGFYNEPFQSPVFGADEAPASYAEPRYETPDLAPPDVISNPWEYRHRHFAHDRERFHAARFHVLTRRF